MKLTLQVLLVPGPSASEGCCKGGNGFGFVPAMTVVSLCSMTWPSAGRDGDLRASLHLHSQQCKCWFGGAGSES